LALGLIASGRVRRARKRVFSSAVVTGIYFHKPNPRLFASCIRWLIKHGYHFISANDLFEVLYRGRKLPGGAVWLSFDDGCRQIAGDVLPVTHALRIPVTLFIPTGIIGGEGVLPWLHETPDANGSPAKNGRRDTITVEELQRIAAYTEVTIGSHTVNHAVTTRLTPVQVGFELKESKRSLDSWIRTDIKCFAYPEGKFDGRERPALAEFGYTMAATTENALITRETDPYLVPRFSVADDIGSLEAICNMVGLWRPTIDPFVKRLR
jgi:peptidoglycan/xylan/chitin deacetylase (PgdA/CDA1 family)